MCVCPSATLPSRIDDAAALPPLWCGMTERKHPEQPMTRSEKVVYDLCRRSALSLWSYANPRKRDRVKELCDALIVFGERIVIFQVKEHSLKDNVEPEVAAQRWLRGAVHEAVAQLHGAHRELASMSRVIRVDGTDGIDLPPIEKRRIHLVAVAAGGQRSIPFVAGGDRNGDGYVHVIEEEALHDILGELDTTADFLHYLEAKEAFSGRIICHGEENLLGWYLHGGRRLPTECELLVVDNDIWAGLRARPEFLARKEADRVSYWWDEMIERFIGDYEVRPTPFRSLIDDSAPVKIIAHTPPSGPVSRVYGEFVSHDVADRRFRKLFLQGLERDAIFRERFLSARANYNGYAGMEAAEALIADKTLLDADLGEVCRGPVRTTPRTSL
jgi:hypothetical protein